jgi:hypothetical protein
MSETTFDKQQTALFLADGHPGYAPGQQNDIAEIDLLPQDEFIRILSDLNVEANNAETVYGTMPDATIVEIGDAPRRPIPPTN